ncbi:helix-turn-helix transcriptional regulator [Arthrobacter alpinus]|nr:transcriptional regulator [Arthrobacter alpinus]
MENMSVTELPLGPKPGRAEPVASISKARAAVLERLRQLDGTLSVEQLATQTGQHANTVREHLEALTGDGHATKTAAPKEGRGRPAWLYQATATPAGPVGYLALAAALAQHLAATSANPAAAGESAGRSWAGALPGASRLGAVAAAEVSSKAGGKVARQRVATVLGQAGFGVRGNRDATELTLTTCPIVEAARENPEVVCAVHLGLAKELLSASGLPEQDVRLLPFAGPGFCTLHLPGSVTP